VCVCVCVYLPACAADKRKRTSARASTRACPPACTPGCAVPLAAAGHCVSAWLRARLLLLLLLLLLLRAGVYAEARTGVDQVRTRAAAHCWRLPIPCLGCLVVQEGCVARGTAREEARGQGERSHLRALLWPPPSRLQQGPSAVQPDIARGCCWMVS